LTLLFFADSFILWGDLQKATPHIKIILYEESHVMSEKVIIVLTAKTKEQILKDGGSSSWKLDCNRARRASYVVCTRNQGRVLEGGKGGEPHQSAFMVGKIKDVVASADDTGRFLIQFSEYAMVNVPDVWKGERNPVKYCDTGNHDISHIDFNTLCWEAMPVTASVEPISLQRGADAVAQPLTLAQAKAGLALAFNVPTESVEITIRL
jgi:hypothetical protein